MYLERGLEVSPKAFFPYETMANECDRCQLNAHSQYLVCAIHPTGPPATPCPDHQPTAPETWDWAPKGYYWYDGELHRDPAPLEESETTHRLNTHPIFTGHCPQCDRPFPSQNPPPVHWDCAECGWVDDSV